MRPIFVTPFAVICALAIGCERASADPACPEGNPTCVTYYTTSTRTVDHITAESVVKQANTLSTELIASMLGASALLDQTYPVALSDPVFQAAVADAKTMLVNNGAVSFSGPTLLSSISNASSTVEMAVTTTDTLVSFSTTLYIGPQIVLTGTDQDHEFHVGPGQILYDTLVTSDVYLLDTTTTTNTDHLTQAYDLIGIPVSAPEPSTWAMLLLGLAGMGLAGWRRVQKPGASNDI